MKYLAYYSEKLFLTPAVHGVFTYGFSRSCHSSEVEESLDWLIARKGLELRE